MSHLCNVADRRGCGATYKLSYCPIVPHRPTQTLYRSLGGGREVLGLMTCFGVEGSGP
jgi:hypothetical protein